MNDLLRRNRKYTAFWAGFLMASVMAFTKILTGAEWVAVMGLIYGSYMAGNVGSHFANRGSSS